MGGLLFFGVLLFTAIFVVLFVVFIESVILCAKDKKRRTFIARVRKQFLKDNPELDPEEFKLRVSRLRARSGCCRAMMWSRISPDEPERHYCDKCGKENIKTARGYAVKEGQ